MREFWVLIGGDIDTMCNLIKTWADCRETVEVAFPNATRIIAI